MALISTKVHGASDYAGAVALIAAPKLLTGNDRRAAAMLRAAGAGTLLASALTDYELGLRRTLPMRVHLMLDAATGIALAAGAVALRRAGAGQGVLLRLFALGGGEVAAALLTQREPADRAAVGEAPVQATPGISGEGLAAATTPLDGPPLAPPPVETPGPSVTPPRTPESSTERAEQAEAVLPDRGAGTGDGLVAQEEALAAAEAARIGGVVPPEVDDPAMEPVYQAGGGEQEGWEAAERALIENASHGDGYGNPERDAISPELEADRATAVYGEADRIPSTEVVEDPSAGADDPGEGPGLAADRGPSEAPVEEPPRRVD